MKSGARWGKVAKSSDEKWQKVDKSRESGQKW